VPRVGLHRVVALRQGRVIADEAIGATSMNEVVAHIVGAAQEGGIRSSDPAAGNKITSFKCTDSRT
jgi:ABC-type sugar transport system ATPase subunit